MNGKIWVTGGGGFLGGAVIAELARRGLGGYVVAPRRRACDLCDRGAVERFMLAERPVLIVHCAAAAGGIGANAAEPARFFHDNAAMALHLVDAAARLGARRLVAIGTTCSYPREAPLPLCEADLWNGAPDAANAPYGQAKRFLLAQLDAYRRQHGLNYLMVIPANLYGPGDHFEAETSHVVAGLVARFVAAADAGAPSVALWGDGTPTRDFLHVRDAARGVVDACLKPGLTGVMNLGSGEETPIAALAERIRLAAGYRGRLTWDAARPTGQPRRALDTSRAAREIGFLPRIRLPAGIDETVAWYRRTFARRAA